MSGSVTFFIASVSLLLGSAAGFVMHRYDFCIAGMFRNVFMFRQWFMLRILLLLIVVSMGLFEGARLVGLLSLYPYPLLGSASLATIVGAFLFGIGMVLSGGCVVGTLYKMGAGSVLSLLAFAGLLFGSAAYAEFHPLWKTFATQTTLSPGVITLPELVGISPSIFVSVAIVLFLIFCIRFHPLSAWTRTVVVDGYLQPWKAAIVLAFIGLLSYVLVGMPLGITTAYAKLGAGLESLFFSQHVAELSYFQALPLDYVPPFFEIAIRGGAGPQWDAVALVQYPLIAGIVLGSTLSARMLDEFKLRLNAPRRQVVSVVLGGVVMGLACRMAPGCNVWHLLGGLPILSLQAIFYLFGLVPGAWAGSFILQRFVLK
ncbi:MAG: hypothetical protein C0618_08590 [Desulfuromonas sp.]|nr:MAG: hypothetical protein C0618_08590 [Desulfuromonas sp.]